MSEPATIAVIETVIEILPPRPALGGKIVICDCCRQRRYACEFDEDACGICSECLDSDAMPMDL